MGVLTPALAFLFLTDEHYWTRKRFVAGAMLTVNVIVDAALLSRRLPAWNDWWFYFYFPGYAAPLAGLVVSRSRRLDYVFLAWAIFVNLSAGFDLLPNSQFGLLSGLGSS